MQYDAATQPQVAPAGETTSADNGAFDAHQVTQEEDVTIDLDELVGYEFADDPVMQGQHKGLNYQEVLKHIPENGRKVIQNLRSSYTQKTQEIAELRRQVETERQELERQRQLLTSSDFADRIRETATAQPQHDIWSDEGLEERINQKAAQMMQQMLTPLQQDLEVQRRQVQLEQFKSNNPDLVSPEIRVPVARLLQERPELKLEDAYYIVKGQHTREQAQQAKQVQKQVLSKTSTGNAVRSGTPPKFSNAWDAYQWHKTNTK